MINPAKIPDEVVEALTNLVFATGLRRRTAGFRLTPDEARAAIAAGLAAWPTMTTGPNIYGRQGAIIHLPLPAQEARDE